MWVRCCKWLLFLMSGFESLFIFVLSWFCLGLVVLVIFVFFVFFLLRILFFFSLFMFVLLIFSFCWFLIWRHWLCSSIYSYLYASDLVNLLLSVYILLWYGFCNCLGLSIDFFFFVHGLCSLLVWTSYLASCILLFYSFFCLCVFEFGTSFCILFCFIVVLWSFLCSNLWLYMCVCIYVYLFCLFFFLFFFFCVSSLLMVCLLFYFIWCELIYIPHVFVFVCVCLSLILVPLFWCTIYDEPHGALHQSLIGLVCGWWTWQVTWRACSASSLLATFWVLPRGLRREVPRWDSRKRLSNSGARRGNYILKFAPYLT